MASKKKTYDVIWIGTGQAVGSILPRLSKAGKRVALIEGGKVGGSCVNYGCTPTKAMVACARAAHMARRGADFGVEIPEFTINFETVRNRMNKIRDNTGMDKWLRNMTNVDFYDGYASFVDDHQIRVGAAEADEEVVLSGETIVIHTGARAYKLPIPGIDNVDWLDNMSLLELKELPNHLLIAGGSYIGMEFGQVFRRLGSQVTILEASNQLMSREDADLAEAATKVLEGEGISVNTSAKVQSVSQSADKEITVVFNVNGEEKQVTGSHLLLAVGRVPNTDTLNPQAAGIETTARGYIPVNEYMQTNIPHIFALGDVNGKGAFTHTSVNDGEIFWDYFAKTGENRTLSLRNTIYAMYIDPPLGRIGMSEKQARESGRTNVLMGTRPMARISRAKEKGETHGLVKILVDGDTEEFLGVGIVGVGADEIINMFAPVMLAKQSYKTFRKAVLAHPTVAELLPWILDDLKPLK